MKGENILKKITALLICIFLLWSVNIYAENIYYNSLEVGKAVAVLEYIGAYSRVQNPDSTDMTRAEFASITAKIINAQEADKNVYFLDVQRDNIYVSQINALKELGFVSGDALYFRPDDAITYAEAAKILLTVSGYDVYANAEGGFPMGYMRVAGRLSLSTKLENTALKHSEALEMIYNAFSMGIYDIEKIDEKYGNLYSTSEQSVFSIYRNICVGEGRILATHTASSSGIAAGKNQIIIDDESYNIDANIYADDLFLNTVEFIYEKRNDNDKYVFYIESVNTADNDDTIINAADLTGFDSNTYTFGYILNDKQRTSTIKRNSVVYYNGEEYTGSITDAINEFTQEKRKGSIRIKDLDRNGDYDTLIIKVYRNVVVNQYGTDKNIIFDASDHKNKIDLNVHEGMSVRNSKMEEINLDITPPTVLQVAESKNKQFAEIIVCDEKLSGRVTKIQNNGEFKYITIGEYTVKADKTYPDILPEFVIGESYSVVLDTFGYVAYASVIYQGDYKIGLLVDCVEKEEIFTKTMVFKILENGGKGVEEIEGAQKIKIDGTDYDMSKDNAFNSIPGANMELDNTNGNVEQQAVRYKLDDDRKIYELDTYFVGEKEDKDNTLTRLPAPLNFNRYMSRFTRLGTSVLRDSVNTITFSKPRMDKNGYLLAYEEASGYNYSEDAYVLDASGNKIQADDSMYNNTYFIKNEEWAMLDVYKFNPNTQYADIIVHTYESFYASTDCFIFDEIGEALNENGEAVPMLYCWQLAEHKGFEISSTLLVTEQGLEKGDLFRCSVNPTTNEVKTIRKVYDCRNDVFYGTDGKIRELKVSGDLVQTTVPDYWYTGQWQLNLKTDKVTSFDYYKNFQLSKGVVLSKIGKALFWDWDGNYDNYEESCDFTNIPLMMIDLSSNRKNNVYSIQPENVLDYKSTGENSGTIVLYNTYLTPRCGYVYVR